MGSALARHKPDWLKVRAPGGANYLRIKSLLRDLALHTVCEEARCPNMGECWGGGTATFMLMGDVCTRGCRFCHVKSGAPQGRLDPDEPRKLARAIGELGLDYIVLTSVDRDDLPDGGASHLAAAVREIKQQHPHMMVEVLIPDFRGDHGALRTMIASAPDVIAHNIETTEPLSRLVRDVRAGYRQSLQVLAFIKRERPSMFTKSSLMLGLGERDEDVRQVLQDLRSVEVDFLTLGQYLQPSPRHLPVVEFVSPEHFERWRETGETLGFRYVAAGPLVRSSYRAGEYFISLGLRRGA